MQGNSVSKTYFDNKLIIFNRKITSKKLNILTRKDYNFFLSGIYFTNNDRSQNTFAYQPTLNTLELNKSKTMIILLVGNQRDYALLNLSHYILLSYIA